MAPINLPDGSEVSEVILPDGSTASEVIAPDGGTVFGNAIPDDVVDNFNEVLYEDDNKTLSDYYDGPTSNFSRTSSDVIEGDHTLRLDSDANANQIVSPSGNGLPRYFKKGEVASCLIEPNGGEVGIGFAEANSASNADFYGAKLENGLDLNKFVGGSYDSTFASDSVSITDGNLYEVEIERHDGSGSESDGTKVVTVYEVDSNFNRTSTIASVKATDTDFGSNDGIAFRVNSAGTGTLIDRYRVTGTV